MYGRSTALRPYPNRCIMKRIKLISCLLLAVLVTFCSVSTALAETYYTKDGLKYMLEENDAYLAGIADDRTSLDVPAYMYDHPVTATTMDFAQKNTNLESVTFENAENIAIIGSYGFYNCTNLRTVNLGPYVTELYRGVFRGCTSLESVELSANITEIPYECFYECSSLGEITLDRNITVIRENAFVGCTNLVIRCYYDSCAHNFAKAHNIPYILLDSVLLGDANGDGYVNISDVTDIQRAVAEMDTLDDLRKKAADINGDGFVMIDDATFLQTYLAEFGTAYPIGEVA